MVLSMGRAQGDTLGTTVCTESGYDTERAEGTSPLTRAPLQTWLRVTASTKAGQSDTRLS